MTDNDRRNGTMSYKENTIKMRGYQTRFGENEIRDKEMNSVSDRTRNALVVPSFSDAASFSSIESQLQLLYFPVCMTDSVSGSIFRNRGRLTLYFSGRMFLSVSLLSSDGGGRRRGGLLVVLSQQPCTDQSIDRSLVPTRFPPLLKTTTTS